MAGTIKVYKHGTEVEIRLNKQKAFIISCKLEVNNVIYQVSYFTIDSCKTADLFDFEFTVIKDCGIITIGFK